MLESSNLILYNTEGGSVHILSSTLKNHHFSTDTGITPLVLTNTLITSIAAQDTGDSYHCRYLKATIL